MDTGLSLRITGLDKGARVAGAEWITIRTTRGPLPTILHPAAEPGRAVICVSGAIGGFDGPAWLYPRLGLEMPRRRGISVLRVNYRAPNEFGECVLDAMAAVSFLKGTGHASAVIIGHSFGGAVAINAGTLSPFITSVVAVSSQLSGAHVVGELAPKPLLLIHGTADTVLAHQSSEALYERAREPKTLKLILGAGHGLVEAADELFDIVEDWLSRAA